MITIDPLDDEVVQKKKPERSRRPSERRSSPHTVEAEKNRENQRHSRLMELALRLLRGKSGEEEV